jgi:CheY-like chemotaxis protein
MVSVLIVEDEVELAANIATYLESFPGEVEAVAAVSGEAALRVVEERPVDVVLTDLRLPGIDGIEVLRQVLARRPGTRIVVMTAFGSEEVRRRALRDGAVRFMEKPVDLGRLRQLILEIGTAPGGWSGSLRGLDIFDFTQLFGLTRKSRTVRARLGSKNGTLVFRNGEIVHASTEELEGAEAFFAMVDWEGGTFHDLPVGDEQQLASNVSVSTTHLLMEAARLRDERAAGAGARRAPLPAAAALPAARDRSRGIPALAVAAPADPALSARLSGALDGVAWARYAAVLGGGGEVLASLGELGPGEEQALWGSVRNVVEGYPRRGLRRLLVEDGTGTVLVASLPGGRRVLLVADGTERTGAVSLRLERLTQALQGEA